jgi:CheY-specific phosphatase CheX
LTAGQRVSVGQGSAQADQLALIGVPALSPEVSPMLDDAAIQALAARMWHTMRCNQFDHLDAHEAAEVLNLLAANLRDTARQLLALDALAKQ